MAALSAGQPPLPPCCGEWPERTHRQRNVSKGPLPGSVFGLCTLDQVHLTFSSSWMKASLTMGGFSRAYWSIPALPRGIASAGRRGEGGGSRKNHAGSTTTAPCCSLPASAGDARWCHVLPGLNRDTHVAPLGSDPSPTQVWGWDGHKGLMGGGVWMERWTGGWTRG